MSAIPNKWLLVEWMEPANIFSHYGIVHTNSLFGNDDDEVRPGKAVFVRAKHGGNPKKALVLKIADDKWQVKEQQLMLERQDNQMKNMVNLCMQTIQDLKATDMSHVVHNGSQFRPSSSWGPNMPSSAATSRHQKMSRSSDSSDQETHVDTKNVYSHAESLKRNRFSMDNGHSSQNMRMAMMSSTPLSTLPVMPVVQMPEPTIMTDQATQTDETSTDVWTEKILHMEFILTKLYRMFLTLMGRLQLKVEDGSDLAAYEFNGVENEDIEPFRRNGEDSKGYQEEDTNVQRKSANPVYVRRASAQTTNNVDRFPVDVDDMTPIGAGNAKVPTRLLNEINWENYTTATRQLLQAIFPRKVLATSSLSGRASSTNSNQPTKKSLDPLLIDDIITTVASRSGVSNNLVRNCISIKCTDEAKMYRTRMMNRSANQSIQNNQENVPPSPVPSRASSNE